jgi:hypothetical protein
LLAEELSKLGNTKVAHFSCLPHTINLVVQDSIKSGTAAIAQLKDTLVHLRKSTTKLAALETICADKKETFLLPTLDCKTRWSSLDTMISTSLSIISFYFLTFYFFIYFLVILFCEISFISLFLYLFYFICKFISKIRNESITHHFVYRNRICYFK